MDNIGLCLIIQEIRQRREGRIECLGLVLLNAKIGSVRLSGLGMGVLKRETGFQQFILDQLAGMSGVTCRAMFGGYGLYQHARFFGIIHHSRLYFKTQERTKERYVREGMKPFRPNPSQTLKNYYEVPPEVIEDSDCLITWAKEAVDV